MKELSIEEKAKRYDELLVKAKQIYNKENDVLIIHTVEDLFPELKESEDERIRQFLIHEVTETSDEIMSYRNMNKKDVLAWLEKQGEHANFRNKIQVGDKVTRNRDGILVNLSQLNRVAKKDEKQGEQKPTIIIPRFRVGDEIKTTNEAPLTITDITDSGYWSEDLFICSFENSTKWELVEQKPADKVEPKFKVGDFIVNDYCMGKVIELTNDAYLLDTGQGIPFSCEHNAHLWTIQDAKDGDVLVTKGDKRPFIFKGLLDSNHPNCPVAYCGIDSENLFLVSTGIYWWTDEEVEPATKEQRDLLFQKMKEAGYEWNAEKKELGKIEQEENVELTDFESALFSAFSHAWQEYLSGKEVNVAKWAKEHSAELLEVAREQKSAAWSEEDEEIYKKVETAIDSYYAPFSRDAEEMSEWFKNLKDRVQPKQEWNEEDEEMYKEVLTDIIYAKNDLKVKECLGLSKRAMKAFTWFSKRYKSLKPQSRWKPSDEQMEALSNALSLAKNCGEENAFDLNTLYEQLKKLREE